MKRTPLLRMTSLLLALLLLTGCAHVEKNTVIAEQATTETTVPEETLPAQIEMPQEELEKALVTIDMSVLCAGFEANQQREILESPYGVTQAQVIRSDYDQDGYQDVLLGRMNHLTFSLSPQRSVDYAFTQTSPVYYTDNDGNLYSRSGLGDGFDIEVDGKPAWVEHMNIWYKQWKNDSWENLYSYKGTITYVDETGSDGETIAREVENTVVADICGTTGTKAELDAHFASIGMREIYSRPADYVRNEYSLAYQDSLLAGMHTYFAENYPGYTQMLRQDIDNDGIEEAVFLLPDFEDTWYHSLRTVDEFNSIQDAQNWFKSAFSDQYNHTGVVIADAEGGKLTITAHCALQYFSAYEGMTLQAENGRLWLDGSPVYLNGRFGGLQSSDVPSALVSYLSDYGYADCFFRTVDVSDFDGDEFMCICNRDSKWYIFIIVIKNGNPITLYCNSLNDSTAVYLTEYKDKQCLLTYCQTVYEQGSDTVNQYDFNVLRINAGGKTNTLDSSYIYYTDKDQDATAVSKFFEKLKVHLIKIIVIRDPYKLTGTMWMDPAEAQHGTVPQEDPQPSDPQQPKQENTQEPIMGFVHIQDPSSWLHLRVGPGLEYDKVLMDPSDPDSYVRQALGSPVTVLETIETDDPEHPVWLKIRISYADREIVGYSSKTYIRLVNE